ncbi:MAG: Ppx/GppA family phosphatase [Bacillota bacterium]|nr:Ppx/GppA family phosphatase [Bacillota bacterium]
MSKIGIIDIGSNSFHLLIVKIEHNNYKIIYEYKEFVRLGDGILSNESLSQIKIEQSIETLKLFKMLCDTNGADKIIAVATAAVRRAKNQAFFINLIKKETSIDVNVLSGEEECYYDYLSIIHSIYIESALLMDIGGSSTEIIYIQNRKPVNSVCLPIGSISLTKEFDLINVIKPENEKKLMDFLYETYNKIPWIKSLKVDTLIGIGGSIRSIGKIHMNTKELTVNYLHNYSFPADDLFSIYDYLISLSYVKRSNISGLSKGRSDIIVGAAASFCVLLKLCNIPTIKISSTGIREGVIYSYLSNNIK